MNKKKTVTLATFVIVALSCLLFTTCNFPVAEDEDDLPLEELEVSRVEYHPNFRLPYVNVYFTHGFNGTGYGKEDGADDWMSKLISIPGLELGRCDFDINLIEWAVDKQTAVDGEPLTAYFSHEEFIKTEGEYWDEKDVARLKIKTNSLTVTIIE